MAKDKPRKGKKPPPKCKALLLCDHVLSDIVSRKLSLVGVINSFSFDDFPARTPEFMAYLQLVDGIGMC